MHICFPFHHGTCTRRVFKFYPRNQSTEKGNSALRTFLMVLWSQSKNGSVSNV